jgi:hypothetical protein
VTDPISAAPARKPDDPIPVAELKGIHSVAACRYAVPGGRFATPPDTADEDVDPNDPNADFGDEGATTPPADEQDPLAEDPGPSDDPSIDPADALAPTIAPLLPGDTPKTAPTLLSSVLLSGDAARDAIHGIAEEKVGTGPDSAGGCDGAAANEVRGTEEIVLRVTANSGNSQIYLRYGGCHNGFDDGVTERVLTRAAVAPFVSFANLIPAYGEELLRILDDANAPATSGHAEEDQATSAPEDTGGATASPDPDS